MNTSKSKTPPPKKSNTPTSKTLVKIRSNRTHSKTPNKENIKLFDYQLKPIRHLVSQCKNQHGLLVNHIMGAGKSYLGAFFAKNYSSKNIVIIIPEGLENVWEDAMETVGIQKGVGAGKYEIITYKKLKKKFMTYYHEKYLTDSVVIIDEAHNLVEIIETFKPSKPKNEEFDKNNKKIVVKKMSEPNVKEKNKLIAFLDNFMEAHKVLLLTGTPIKNDIADIRWLINIAAGKKIVPYNQVDFIKQYYNKSKIDAVLNGWLSPILNLEIAGRTLPQKYRIHFRYLVSYTSEIANIIDDYINKKSIVTLLHNTPLKIGDAASFMILNPEMLKLSYNEVMKRVHPGTVLTENDFAIAKNKSFQITLLRFVFATIVTKGVMMLYAFLTKYYNNKFNYVSLNVNKMAVVAPYVSFYKYLNNNPNYPSVKIISKPVSYTDYQLSFWARTIYNFDITDQETLDLGLTTTIGEAELFKPSEIGETEYITKGRIIGNIDNSQGYTQPPIKFIEILKLYNEKKESTMVYSNFFDSGIMQFALFLKSKGVPYTLYTPSLSSDEKNKILSDFKKKKITLLLLHPAFFEGFSIQGVRAFHILEPINEYYKKEQLYARAVRFGSHAHLPENERNIVIYQWRCSLKSVFRKIRKMKGELINWFERGLQTVFFEYESKYDSSLSPDDIAYNTVNLVEYKLQEFSRMLKLNSIEEEQTKKRTLVSNGSKSKKEDLCCVYGDYTCKSSQKPCNF